MKLAANSYAFSYRAPSGAAVVMLVRLSLVSAIQPKSSDAGVANPEALYVIGEAFPSMTGTRAEFLRELSAIRFTFPHAEEFVTDQEALGQEVEGHLTQYMPDGFTLRF